MEPLRSVLILQGDLCDAEILDLLDSLLDKVEEKSRRRLHPWELFSLVCASGTAGTLAILLGRLAKSTRECRAHLKYLEQARHSQHLCSSLSAWRAHAGVMRQLEQLCGPPSSFRFARTGANRTGGLNALSEEEKSKRCHNFILVPREPASAPVHLTTYPYSPLAEDGEDITTHEALLRSLGVREYPFEEPDLRRRIETPSHALMTEVTIRKDLHNDKICVFFKRFCDKPKTCKIESTSVQCIELVPDGSSDELERAASALSDWIDCLGQPAWL